MEWIKRKLGIDKIILEQQKTNTLLERIAKQSERNADLQEKHNKAFNIK